MASLANFCYYLTLVFLVINGAALGGRKDTSVPVLQFVQFDDCKRPGSPNRIVDAKVRQQGRGVTLINVGYLANRPIPEGKFRIKVNKCSTECERFLKFTVDFCTIFEEKGMPWSRFTEASRPRMKCPIKKGLYKFINATLDASEVMSMGNIPFTSWMEQYTWKVEFEVVHKGESLSCGLCVIKYSRVKTG